MYKDSLFLVTSKCNLDCPFCSRWFFHKDYSGYQMSMEELSDICTRVTDLGIHFDAVRVTGGEPTLWKHLGKGLRLIRESGITDKIMLMSNCVTVNETISLIEADYIDEVRTNLAVEMKNRYNAKGIEKLKAKFPDKVYVVMDTHFPHPWPPLEDVLPAGWKNGRIGCVCDHVTFLGHEVFQCANEHDRCRFAGEKPEPTNLFEDWITHFNDPKKFNRLMCSVCLVNPKVKAKISKARKNYGTGEL